MSYRAVLLKNALLNVLIAVKTILRIVLYVLQIYLHVVADSVLYMAVCRIDTVNKSLIAFIKSSVA
jgi:hypothetical protein